MDSKEATLGTARRIARAAQRRLTQKWPLAASARDEAENDTGAERIEVDGFEYELPNVDLGVLLVPLARYHAIELREIRDRLADLDIASSYFVPEELVSAIDDVLTEGNRIVWREDQPLEELPAFSALVAMNDWGPSRSLYHQARVRGCPSFAKVEGVQDYRDLDTGRIRLPYLAADYVLAQGPNDLASLCDRPNVHVVGNSILESAWQEPLPPEPRNRSVVINSNFTYGVLNEARLDFLTQCVSAIQQLGMRPVISQHPADRPLPDSMARFVSQDRMSELILTCEVLISRFSTVPYEAAARGTPFIYFNPHGERVPTFHVDSPAFERPATIQDLKGSLQRAVDSRPGFKAVAEPWFHQQVDVSQTPSAARSAATIKCVLAAQLTPVV